MKYLLLVLVDEKQWKAIPSPAATRSCASSDSDREKFKQVDVDSTGAWICCASEDMK